eukprot:1176393-Prorocentrum_minimum.AAC.9
MKRTTTRCCSSRASSRRESNPAELLTHAGPEPTRGQRRCRQRHVLPSYKSLLRPYHPKALPPLHGRSAD